MQSRRITAGAETVHVLVFDPGDEATDRLLNYAKEHNLTAARFTALGAFKECTLGWFDIDKQDYHEIQIEEQVEVLSLIGNVAVYDGRPKVHAHAVVGKRDGRAYGGHLLRAVVRPTLEVSLIESPVELERQMNPAFGLPLIAPAAR